MKKEIRNTEAGRQYATAHAAHYTTKNLHQALNMYKDIVAAYPDTAEAKYSRSQIQNIVNSEVPKQEIFDAQVKLALSHIEHYGPPDAKLAPN